MKRTAAFALAALCALALPASALADTINGQGSQQATVTGSYRSGGESQTVYSVEISWEKLNFTYTGAFKGTWNPSTHTYDDATEASWNGGQGTLTIANNSNTEIQAKFKYTPQTGYESADMDFSSNDIVVDSADNESGEEGKGSTVTETVTVTPSGSLPETTAENTKIGTITITIQ